MVTSFFSQPVLNGFCARLTPQQLLKLEKLVPKTTENDTVAGDDALESKRFDCLTLKHAHRFMHNIAKTDVRIMEFSLCS